MRNLIAATSIVLLALSTQAFAQSFGDMDSSGRFGGMPPGTDRYREDADQGGFAIPLDPVETDATITVVAPPQSVSCPRPGTRQWRTAERNGTLDLGCR
jgi:hypothetical protein